jgi:hypothetical protein
MLKFLGGGESSPPVKIGVESKQKIYSGRRKWATNLTNLWKYGSRKIYYFLIYGQPHC